MPLWNKKDLKKLRSNSSSARWRQPQWPAENQTGMMIVPEGMRDAIAPGDYVIVGEEWRKVEHLLTNCPQMAMVVALEGEPVDRARLANPDSQIYITVDPPQPYDAAQRYEEMIVRMIGLAKHQPQPGKINAVIDGAKLALLDLMLSEIESWTLQVPEVSKASALHDCLSSLASQIKDGYPPGCFEEFKANLRVFQEIDQRF